MPGMTKKYSVAESNTFDLHQQQGEETHRTGVQHEKFFNKKPRQVFPDEVDNGA